MWWTRYSWDKMTIKTMRLLIINILSIMKYLIHSDYNYLLPHLVYSRFICMYHIHDSTMTHIHTHGCLMSVALIYIIFCYGSTIQINIAVYFYSRRYFLPLILVWHLRLALKSHHYLFWCIIFSINFVSRVSRSVRSERATSVIQYIGVIYQKCTTSSYSELHTLLLCSIFGNRVCTWVAKYFNYLLFVVENLSIYTIYVCIYVRAT